MKKIIEKISRLFKFNELQAQLEIKEAEFIKGLKKIDIIQDAITEKETRISDLMHQIGKIEKQKKEMDRELLVYKQEKYLDTDREVFSRMKNNWEAVEQSRIEFNNQSPLLKSKEAKLEARIDEFNKYREQIELRITDKYAEITRLNAIIEKMVDKTVLFS